MPECRNRILSTRKVSVWIYRCGKRAGVESKRNIKPECGPGRLASGGAAGYQLPR